MKYLSYPISTTDIDNLEVGDIVSISGDVLCGRDAVLPKIVQLINNELLNANGIDLTGTIIFHTAVSPAGIGPTSSNKIEIESSIPILSAAGVRLHLGKGSISVNTIEALTINKSAYAIIPPITALLESKTLSKEIVAFPELGMEALYRIKVTDFQAIIAAANGNSIY